MLALHLLAGSLQRRSRLERGPSGCRGGVQPIGQDAVADELVEGCAVISQDCLGPFVPGSYYGCELVGLEVFGKSREVLDIADEEDGVSRSHIGDSDVGLHVVEPR